LQTEILTQLVICINKTQPVQMKRDASLCLVHMTKVPKGKLMIFEFDFIGNIFNLLFDPDEAVKVHGYEVLFNLSGEFLGREKVANEGYIKRLIEFLSVEDNNIKK